MDDAPITLAEMVEEADVMVTEIWCNCERAERLGLPPNAYIKRRIAVMAEIARYLRGQQGD